MSSRVSDTSSPEPSVATYCHLKVLIPSAAVGSIMGRNGEVMSSLEEVTRTKIVLSAMKDFYPGTRDRVCLISGTIDDIMLVNKIIMKKLATNPHLCYSSSKGGKSKKDPHDADSKSEIFMRQKQMKIIIPQSSASKIIGKNGNNIERLKVSSGSVIQLSRKAFPVVLRERIVTISGQLDSNDIACRLLLQIIAPDTDEEFYKNVSYSEARYPLPSTYMVGSPFAANTNHTSNARFEPPKTTIRRRDVLIFLESFRETLRGMAYPQDAITRSSDAIMALNDHKVLDLCLSMLINWFYPKAFSVYLKNGGVPRIESRPSSPAAGEGNIRELEQLCARSMFISERESDEDQPGASGLVNYECYDTQSDEYDSRFKISDEENYDYNYDYDNWLLSKRDTWKYE